LGSAANPLEPTERVDEFRWLEPFPDAALLITADHPEARYVRREGMSLAFIVALQRLPASQRAVLILRDVLDLRASEVAELLTMTIPAVNSSLHRARAAMAKHHVTDRASPPLADRRLLDVVNEFIDAMEEGDLPRVLATLTANAKWIMPPLSAWYQGRDAIATFIATRVLAARTRGIARRRILTWANGQPALAVYHQASARRVYEAFALQVLTIDVSSWQISEVTTFLNADLFRAFGLARDIPM
jgi:RNA polymerase sigma-70 factor (ECF subfamily)